MPGLPLDVQVALLTAINDRLRRIATEALEEFEETATRLRNELGETK